MDETIKLIAEADVGAIYHDEQNDEWLVDIATKGITLYFDRDEFEQFVQLLKPALTYAWDVAIHPFVPPERRASGE